MNADWRVGEFFTYGKNSFSAGASNLDNTDYRLGVYGLREKGPQQTFVYFDIGRQTNDSKPDSQKREYDLQCSHFGHEYREKSAGFGDGEEELVNYRLSGSLFFDEVGAAEPEGIQHSAEPTC